ncbi:putative bifunctional diguanylate cyclase/phosphodiesterase [Aestuariirhabdus litorea]|uniref:EAL domain-containing protein n=1 Tax=Aestuariirhabdus litorea TaxID=2528527 RepID=A0A3P3VJ52_9GAMM|nr:EAL domain-containing protein [Aestuariirhabdus litorea]RRJ82384.1 EAL domain-containing protein [Aestuariirhabdus litorea]RWW92547.1 EAL domain-containing protein [Endozoicomonadaceae bacterium GTF-13]
MPQFKYSHRLLTALLCFAAVFALGSYWTQLSYRSAQNEQRLLMQQLVDSEASAIERRLSRSLSSTDILAQEVRQQGGDFRDFDEYAHGVIQAIGGVSNLQLAPDGVIRKVYPLEGNEKALGHDILNDDSRREEAHKAIASRRMTLAGPFELVQGGIAVIGRNPVFIYRDGEEYFWGFTSALIFLEDLLEVTDLEALERKGYRYRLSRFDPVSRQQVTFASSESPVAEDAFEYAIAVPNAQWRLAMSRPPSALDSLFSLGYPVSFLAGLLVSWMVNLLLRQPETLRQVVEDKTRRLQELAFYDPLTGLANRRLLHEQLELVLKRLHRDGDRAALLYLDLDDFKLVNDSMGHTAGDNLLAQVAQRLRSVVRESDLVARLGGDEFGILLQDTHEPSAITRVCDKLIRAIEEPLTVGGKEFLVSVSIGVTLLPEDGRTVETLLRNADLAMYDAKREGKHQYRLFNDAMRDQLVQRMRIEEDLRSALELEQFELHLQPLVSFTARQVMGYEALIRWRHPQQGLLYPDAFIGVAEQSGLIREIGYRVIREACRLLRDEQALLGDGCMIAVNLSPAQFSDPELLSRIEATVLEHGIGRGRLELEITESVLMRDLDEAIGILNRVQALGIGIAIDDFGTGYSSLAYVKRLPINKLKIDRSFIQTLSWDRSDQMIVEAIIAMAHKLELEVVAEGVEDEDQYHRLEAYRCDIAQGYWMSRPQSLESLVGVPQKIAGMLQGRGAAS